MRAIVQDAYGSAAVSSTIDDLIALTELIEAGELTPVVERAYPLSETSQALLHVGVGRAQGEVVVTA
jgi:NADPH:quinone reductase-like Zn-dependent oxidoreductase